MRPAPESSCQPSIQQTENSTPSLARPTFVFFKRVLAFLLFGALTSGMLTTVAAPANAAIITVDMSGVKYTLNPNFSESGATLNYCAPATVVGNDRLYVWTQMVHQGVVYPLYRIALSACSNRKLAEIVLPASLKTIGGGAFTGNLIENLHIPSNVTDIERSAFENNPLTSLDLSQAHSLTTIGSQAFLNASLSQVTIPASVTSVGAGAFARSSGSPLYVNLDGNAPTVTPAGSRGSFGDATNTYISIFRDATGFDIDEQGRWNGYKIYYRDHIVSFDSRGGSPVPQQNVLHATTVNIPGDPTREHYTFTGWFDETTNEPWKFGAKVLQNYTLYAGWALNKYKVTFDSQNGSTSKAVAVNAGSKVPAPDAPTRHGYTFVNWSREKTGSGAFDFSEAVSEPFTLYAIWKPKDYIVFLDPNGGKNAGASTLTAAFDSILSPPASPTRHGFEFTGWHSDKQATKPYDFTSKVSGNVELYAGWKTAQNPLTFDYQDGRPATQQLVTYGDTASPPRDPSRTGHKFTGWFKDTSLKNPFTFDTRITKPLTVYAGWSLNSYRVTFNSQGGSTVDAVQVKHGSTIDEPNSPQREGHTFAGWYTDKQLKSPFDFSTQATGDLQLFAAWKTMSHVVSVDLQDGSAITEILITHGAKLPELPAPKREDFLFTGWYTDAAAKEPYKFTAQVTSPFTLYAGWKAAKLDVIFDSQGGSPVSTITVDNGATVSKPSDPTRNGYTFVDWFTEKDGKTRYDFDLAVTESRTLYAHWKPNEYTVTFDPAGGKNTGAFTVSAKHDGVIEEPKSPTRVGYSFTGWHTDPEATQPYDFATKVSGAFTLYAGWNINSYSVRFDAQNDTEITTQSVNHGGHVTLPPTPTSVGRTFTGWYTDAKTTTAFSDDHEVTQPFTLYAGWKTAVYVVTLDAQNGTKHSTITVNHGSTIETPADPVREGHTFSGWYSTPEATDTFDFTAKITEPLTVYAGWTINSYPVTVHLGDGSDATTTQITHGNSFAEPGTPTFTWHTFAGWYSSATAPQPYDFTAPVTGELHVYARWTLNTYAVTFDPRSQPGPTQATVSHGDTVAVPTPPVREGHTFTGWYLDEASSAAYNFATAVVGDLTLYAGWETNVYTLQFESNGGTAVDPVQARYDSPFAEPDMPKREGYLFTGWFVDSNLDLQYAFTQPAHNSMELFAGWVGVPLTVTIDPGNGKPPYPMSVRYGEMLPSLITPKRIGFSFTGWYSDIKSSVAFDPKSIITGDITIYAGWKQDPQTRKADTSHFRLPITGGSPWQLVAAVGGVTLLVLGLGAWRRGTRAKRAK